MNREKPPQESKKIGNIEERESLILKKKKLQDWLNQFAEGKVYIRNLIEWQPFWEDNKDKLGTLEALKATIKKQLKEILPTK
jgi:hypothetical protein